MSYPTTSDWLFFYVDETNEMQEEWKGLKRLAITKKTYYSGPPWQSPRKYIREGELCYVIPANNQPKESGIKFWTIPITGLEEWASDAIGAYGIPQSEGDVELI